MGQPLPPKKDVILALLERATVFVHVDPRRQGCVVPMNFKSQPQLVLQVGLNMAVPIPDLRVEDAGITCTLSFGGRGFWCSMPWSCVYAMVGEDGRGMVWPDDLPPEVQAASASAAATAGATKPSPSPQKATRKTKRAKPVTVTDKPARPAKAAAKKPAKKRTSKQPPEESLPPPADIRQRLVAVKPAEDSTPTSEPAVAEERDGTSAPEARRGQHLVERRALETPPPMGQRKPKRELPPYLRVVK